IDACTVTKFIQNLVTQFSYTLENVQ
ncbi:MAG: hypothetical protein K0S91_3299, partial [Nitrososphaeraceae archaeon]|nr:hypothetical protein [Nitrososphaeraceae archaeon]